MLMRSWASALLLAVAVATSPINSPAAQSPQAGPSAGAPRTLPGDADVLALIKARVDAKRSAGIVVGLVEPTGRTRVVAQGDPGPAQLPLDADSVFEIGSITKVFTGTLLAVLVQSGAVRLDDPVQKYLPPGVQMPVYEGKPITLGHLAEQNSGLPRLPSNLRPANMANPYADYSVDQLYAFLNGYRLTRGPGTTFEYSNLGVGLLGHVLALSQKTPYEALLREHVWTPLGMSHTGITLTPWMQRHLALGHDPSGSVVPNWDIATLAGAGAIRSTTGDMLKFLDANLHPERGPLHRAMALAQTSRAPTTPPNAIGLNWMIRRVGDRDTILWHNGGTAGYRSFIGLDPLQRHGVVVLTNSGGAGADDLGFHLVNPVVPLASGLRAF
jgi:CubicO group peptidase (beta-lactamase class C family)